MSLNHINHALLLSNANANLFNVHGCFERTPALMTQGAAGKPTWSGDLPKRRHPRPDRADMAMRHACGGWLDVNRAV